VCSGQRTECRLASARRPDLRTYAPPMRDIETIDSELRLVAALRRAARERGGPLPSIAVAECAAGMNACELTEWATTPQAHTLLSTDPTAAFKRTWRLRGHRLYGDEQQPSWQPRPLSPQERMQMLEHAITGLASQGGRLVARHEWTAVVLMGKPVNHVLHLILTICSICCGGIWAPVWLLITAVGGEHRQILTVDQYGQVSQRRGPLEMYRKVLIGIVAALFVLWFVGVITAASTTCVGPAVAVCVRTD
jgi:hypothetical protein